MVLGYVVLLLSKFKLKLKFIEVSGTLQQSSDNFECSKHPEISRFPQFPGLKFSKKIQKVPVFLEPQSIEIPPNSK